MNLSAPIEQIPRVGPQYQKKLKKLGIKTVRDLLFHFPHRYEDFSNIVPVSEIKSGTINSIQGKILKIENKRTWKKRMILTEALVQDESGTIKVVWFNQHYLINTLKTGDLVCLSGKLTLRDKETYLSSPSYEKISPLPFFGLKKGELTHTGRLVPVYPETEGLSSRWLRFILKPLLSKLKKEIPDSLPKKLKEKHKLLDLEQAIWQIHFPDSLSLAEKAKQRLQFEELFLIMLLVLRKRQKLSKEKARIIPLNLETVKSFVKTLPFELTDSQKKAAWQILKDLEKPRPMNRLLEGDVGSGKTVVAVIAVLNAAKAGFQIAFMAPTEILAKQHFKTIQKLLKDFNIKIGFLTGKENKFQNKKILRKKLIEKIKNKEIDLLIGTHTLIQEQIKFGELALVIIDEQHRFGVEQRSQLCLQKDTIPHLLSMTATPIPRTLSLTIYGDLDLSLIKELPKGRKKVITKVIPPKQRKKAYDFIREQVKKGGQVFVICPRIEKSEIRSTKFETKRKDILGWTEAKAVKEEYEKLSKQVFPNLKIGMLHGKMIIKEKEKTMKKFKDKKIDILVATSVIEVGIDIPNAVIMMIEGAERFGLAQLHQFRGRVGRAEQQSFCFLFTDSPAKKTYQRLKALISSENGFDLAEKDLQIRGPGDFTGERQSGIPDLIMDSLKNIFLVEKTREAAREILIEDPELKKYPLLIKRIQELQKRIHLE